MLTLFSRYLLTLLVLIPLSACGETPYTNIDNQQLRTLQAQGIPVYDIRRADEWKQTGIVEGSHKLTFVDDNGRINPEFVSRAQLDTRATPAAGRTNQGLEPVGAVNRPAKR